MIFPNTRTIRMPSAAEANAPYGVVADTAAAVMEPNALLRLLLCGFWKLVWLRTLKKLAPSVNSLGPGIQHAGQELTILCQVIGYERQSLLPVDDAERIACAEEERSGDLPSVRQRSSAND